MDRFLLCCTILGATYGWGLNLLALLGRYYPTHSPVFLGSVAVWLAALVLLGRGVYILDRRLES